MQLTDFIEVMVAYIFGSYSIYLGLQGNLKIDKVEVPSLFYMSRKSILIHSPQKAYTSIFTFSSFSNQSRSAFVASLLVTSDRCEIGDGFGSFYQPMPFGIQPSLV